MSNPEHPAPGRVMSVEHLSLEECVARLSRILSRDPDFYPGYYLARAAHVYLSPFTADERTHIYGNLGYKTLSILKGGIERYLARYSPDDAYAFILKINPVCSADLTEEAFPLAPARQVLAELVSVDTQGR